MSELKRAFTCQSRSFLPCAGVLVQKFQTAAKLHSLLTGSTSESRGAV